MLLQQIGFGLGEGGRGLFTFLKVSSSTPRNKCFYVNYRIFSFFSFDTFLSNFFFSKLALKHFFVVSGGFFSLLAGTTDGNQNEFLFS